MGRSAYHHKLGSTAMARDEPGQHLGHADEERASVVAEGGSRLRADAKDIDDGRAFHRGAASDDEEPRLVERREPAQALAQIEDDGRRGALELIAKIGEAPTGHQLPNEIEELERHAVDIAALRVQERSAGGSPGIERVVGHANLLAAAGIAAFAPQAAIPVARSPGQARPRSLQACCQRVQSAHRAGGAPAREPVPRPVRRISVPDEFAIPSP